MNLADLLALVAARSTEEGDCLIWQGYTFNGHPGMTLDGKKVLVRRALWAAAHGAIPAGRVLRCSCGERLCVHLPHFKLSTFKAIGLEEAALGKMSGPVRSAKIAAAKRAGPQARLTAEAVAEFRSSAETATSFAKRHGIALSTACKVRRGQVWREHTGVWGGLLGARTGAA